MNSFTKPCLECVKKDVCKYYEDMNKMENNLSKCNIPDMFSIHISCEYFSLPKPSIAIR